MRTILLCSLSAAFGCNASDTPDDRDQDATPVSDANHDVETTPETRTILGAEIDPASGLLTITFDGEASLGDATGFRVSGWFSGRYTEAEISHNLLDVARIPCILPEPRELECDHATEPAPMSPVSTGEATELAFEFEDEWHPFVRLGCNYDPAEFCLEDGAVECTWGMFLHVDPEVGPLANATVEPAFPGWVTLGLLQPPLTLAEPEELIPPPIAIQCRN